MICLFIYFMVRFPRISIKYYTTDLVLDKSVAFFNNTFIRGCSKIMLHTRQPITLQL
jgi:hypothetical protein